MNCYFPDTYRSQTIFRCCLCQYDSFSEANILLHGKYNHRFQGLPEESIPLGDWVSEKRRLSEAKGRKVAIGFLTWNTEDASALAAHAIKTEMDISGYLGIETRLFWVDNGSTDRTVPVLLHMLEDRSVWTCLNDQNKGQSAARNAILQAALDWGCDYLLMVDGDVEPIMYSLQAMTRYLIDAPLDVGCIGINSMNCTHVRDEYVAHFCRKIEPWMVTGEPNIAWTNYGLFRRTVLEAVKFDETGPFAGPGWGYEDDDYVLAMGRAGFASFNTKCFRFMHRRRNSSLKNLGPSPAAEVFRARQKYMVQKWGTSKDRAIMAHIRRISAQGLPKISY